MKKKKEEKERKKEQRDFESVHAALTSLDLHGKTLGCAHIN